MPISYHFKIDSFQFQRTICSNWIKSCISYYKYKVGEINIIFTSESEIINLNFHYLDHNYSTDILTFNYNSDNIISGDIFICVSQVKNNSIDYKTSFDNELYRVIIHGILHLVGFNDLTRKQQLEMKSKENFWLYRL